MIRKSISKKQLVAWYNERMGYGDKMWEIIDGRIYEHQWGYGDVTKVVDIDDTYRKLITVYNKFNHSHFTSSYSYYKRFENRRERRYARHMIHNEQYDDIPLQRIVRRRSWTIHV